jgi:hypothetical protein
MALGKKTGGRSKGVPNKRTKELAAKIEAAERSGETPLEFMLNRMRDAEAPIEDRMEMAKAAAPYVHPKLANIEHGGAGGGPMRVEFVTIYETKP